MAEYSFQALMPNSPLLLNYLCFGASFKVNHRSIYSRRFYSRILARVCAVAIATALIKNKAYKMVFVDLKKIQSLDCFHRQPTMN